MRRIFYVKLSLLVLLAFADFASAQTSAFTYQGKLTDTSAAANGQYDFTFRLFDDLAGGTQIGSGAVCNGAVSGNADAVCDNVQVSGGIFTVNLSFGADAFADGGLRFLEISVRTGTSTGAYTTLTPLQQVTSSPFSLKSRSATFADTLSAACVLCVTDAKIQSIDGSKVTGTVANAVTANNVSGVVQIGNGGTGSSTQNFVDLSTNQSNIGGNKTFTGTLSGNGSGLTNLNGANLTDGSVSTAKIADGAITENKLSPDQRQLLADARNLSLVGLLRWDLLKTQTVVPIGSAPEGIAFDGTNMWVANTGGNSVTKIRVSDGAILATVFGVFAPRYIAFDGINIWVTSSTELVKIRASDGQILNFINISSELSGIAFDGANIWVVTDSGGGSLRKINPETNQTLGNFLVGGNPAHIAFDGANIWTTSTSSSVIAKLRASDGAIQGTFNIKGNSFGIAFDGVNIWVSTFSNRVKRLRASDGVQLSEIIIPGGLSATQRGIVFDGTNIWVTDFANNTVVKICASDGTNLGSFPTGNSPIGLAFDGVNIWVTNQAGNSATKMPPSFPR